MPQSDELFRARLDEQINMAHPLVRLGSLIDWSEIERTFSMHFSCGRGCPALPPHLVAGLLYLQHAFDASDEAVVNTWLENRYWQHFCGEVYLRTKAPIDPSSLTRWRQRIGEEGVEILLMVTIEAARKAGVIKKASVDRVIVGTTVMPKAIAHPADSRLLDKSCQHPVKVVPRTRHGASPELQLRGSGSGRADRYAHPKQFKRMQGALRTLRTRVARVQREVQRQQSTRRPRSTTCCNEPGAS